MFNIEWLQSLALLIALSVLSNFIESKWKINSLIGKIFQGILFGAVAMIGMMSPFNLSKGIIFDGRSIVISLCAAFFGPIAGLISSIMAIIYRFLIGGGGTLMGILVSASSFLIGFYFYHWQRKSSSNYLSNWKLYQLGIYVHVAMLLLVLTLPPDKIVDTYKNITLMVLFIYPVVTLLIGKILKDHEDKTKLFAELKNSEAIFRSLAESSPSAIFIYQGNKFAYVNPAAETLAGYTQQELLQKNFWDVVHPDFRELIKLRGLQRQEGKPIPSRYEFKIVHKSGKERWIDFSSTLINYQGKTAALGIAYDITEQKKAIDELIDTKEKAEESNRLKTAFLHNVSHEVRTPLNVIVGYTNLIRSENLTLEEVKNLTEPITNNAYQLLNIIQDILDISQLESKQGIIHKEEISIKKLIKESITSFSVIAKEKNLKLFYGELPDDNTTVLTDKIKLQKILNNIVMNAIKYTDTGYVKISAKISEGEALFSISDTGIGIDKKDFEKIFLPFERTTESISKQYNAQTSGGVGLGLSIAKELVEMLKGKIWLESEIGRGTTFYFTIPL
ncbi:MAG: ATP-binding protein [Bacteroidota bacterium]